MARCWYFVSVSLILALVQFLSVSLAETYTGETGSDRVKRVRDRVIQNSQFSICEISKELVDGLSKVEGRIAIFEFVRDFEYRIGNWRPNHPEDIIARRLGDCRHKADLLEALLKCAGYEARKVRVIFDWADLPVPPDILKIRGISKGIHDAVEVYLEDRWVYLDATWSIGMKSAGFPVTEDWDGNSSTRQVTTGAVQIIESSAEQDLTLLHWKYKVPWPVRSKNLEFVQSLNAWLQTSQ